MEKLAYRSMARRGALALCLLLSGSVLVRAQEPAPPATPPAEARRGQDEINFDAQLHLLVASSEAEARGSYPPALEAAVRQLRAALPQASYRLAGTVLYRLRDNGNLEVSGIGGFALIPPSAPPTAQISYSFTLSRLRQRVEAGGPPLITIERLRFGLRLPVVTGTARAEGSAQGFPIINYENVGLSTELSLREATPTVVGTLTTSRPEELLVLVLTVRRAAAR